MSGGQQPEHKWSPGDRVRVDIPDETDPDHRRHHGRHGRVIATISSSPDGDGDPEQVTYRVAFDGGGFADLRFFDLRPPIVE